MTTRRLERCRRARGYRRCVGRRSIHPRAGFRESCLAVALAALSLAACGPAGFRNGASPGALEQAEHEPPTGAAGPGLERFDALIQNILERSGIPGASLAMARRGKLVLARGYGLADVAAGARVQPQTRFMLASVSKAITAVTVLKLVQEGRLSLDATVLPFLPVAEPPADPRWHMITVEMLLRHEGGWNRRTSGDPLTWNVRVARALHVRRPVTPEQLARYMLGQPLDFTPGTDAVYSNFGYMLLGMIVERVAGAPYAEVAQSTTLVPMGSRG